MILYNITIIVEDSINTEWADWINKGFIDPVMRTTLFASNRILKVVDSPNEGVTYCLQFIADNIGNYHRFKQEYEPALNEALNKRFTGRFVSFNTLMEFVD